MLSLSRNSWMNYLVKYIKLFQNKYKVTEIYMKQVWTHFVRGDETQSQSHLQSPHSPTFYSMGSLKLSQTTRLATPPPPRNC